MIESVYIQHLRPRNGVKVIYFGEFSLIRRHTNLYELAKTEPKGYILKSNESLLDFIVGFSRSHFYDILINTSTIDANIVI